MYEYGVAWVTGTPELVTAVRSAKQFLTYVSSGPFQYAIAEALALPDAYYDSFRADLAAKRDLLSDGLAAAGFEVFRPQGTYFVTTDITPSASATASPSAGPCRSAAGWSPSRTRSSTTTRPPAPPTSAGPSASERLYCRRRLSASVGWPSESEPDGRAGVGQAFYSRPRAARERRAIQCPSGAE